MRRFSFAHAAFVLLVAASAVAAEPSSPPNVHFKSSVGEAQGYLATPAKAAGKRPAIIVIQEWWGVDDWIRQQTDRFAKDGYVALAVDLYRGKVASGADEAHELMRGLPEDRAMADLKGAFHYLQSRKDVDGKRIAVVGWCMGGGYALMLATAEPKLSGAVINYGHLMTDPKTIASLRVPLLGNFGAADRGIPAEDVKAFESALHKDGKSADFKIYDGAGHAFMNPNNKAGYVPAAAEDAWNRIDHFLTKELHGKIPNP